MSKKTKIVFCPAMRGDCPYFGEKGTCELYPKFDPRQECEDFAFFWDAGENYVTNWEDVTKHIGKML